MCATCDLLRAISPDMPDAPEDALDDHALNDAVSDLVASLLVDRAIKQTDRLVVDADSHIVLLDGPGAEKIRHRWVAELKARANGDGNFTCKHFSVPYTAFGRAATGRGGFVRCGRCSEQESEHLDRHPACDLCGRQPRTGEQFARAIVQHRYILILTVACKACRIAEKTEQVAAQLRRYATSHAN